MNENSYATIALEIANLVEEKNKAYDNSLNSVGDLLKVFFPNGLQPEQYEFSSVLVRLLDKLKRACSNPDDEENWKDIIGYSLLRLKKIRDNQDNDIPF